MILTGELVIRYEKDNNSTSWFFIQTIVSVVDIRDW